MSKRKKGFNEDSNPGDIIMWVNDIIWMYTDTIANRDPAKVEYRTAHKIRIKIEIFDEEDNLLPLQNSHEDFA